MARASVPIVFLLLSLFSSAFAQTDADKFAEGRIAFDKYKDCRAARDAFESVSETGRSEALWVLYAAKTYQCLGELDKALALYVKYNRLVGDRTDIIEKIGELRYQITVKRRAEEAEQASRQRAQRERSNLLAKLQAVSNPGDKLKLIMGELRTAPTLLSDAELEENSAIAVDYLAKALDRLDEAAKRFAGTYVSTGTRGHSDYRIVYTYLGKPDCSSGLDFVVEYLEDTWFFPNNHKDRYRFHLDRAESITLKVYADGILIQGLSVPESGMANASPLAERLSEAQSICIAVKDFEAFRRRR